MVIDIKNSDIRKNALNALKEINFYLNGINRIGSMVKLDQTGQYLDKEYGSTYSNFL